MYLQASLATRIKWEQGEWVGWDLWSEEGDSLASQPIPCYDRGRMDLEFHQIFCMLQQLSCQNNLQGKGESVTLGQGESLFRALPHHRGGPVPNLLILQVSQLHQNLGRWVFDFQQLQDGGPVIGDSHVLMQEEE